jgi:hypothetical protein
VKGQAVAIAGFFALSFQASAQNVQALPTAIIPSLAGELPAIRIGWRMNDFKASLEDAQRDGKPVVVLFVRDVAHTNNYPYIRAFFAHVLRCPTFNTLAGSAHFAIVDPTFSRDYAQLASSFKVDQYPAMFYLTVKATNINIDFSSFGAFNEGGVLSNAQAAGLKPRKPGSPAEASLLGSAKPEACTAQSGVMPDNLPKVEVVFQGR